MFSKATKVITALMLLVIFSLNANAQRIKGTPEEIKDWQLSNQPKYDKYHDKGKILTITGASLFGVGVAMAVTGGYYLRNTNSLLESDDVANNRKRGAGLGLAICCPFVMIPGFVLGIIGAVDLGKAHQIRVKGKRIGAELAYSPYISPINNSYGVNIGVTF